MSLYLWLFMGISINASSMTISETDQNRVILKKNLVNVNGIRKNLLTQDMFLSEISDNRDPNINIVFYIQQDFVLAEDITIPVNSVLDFDGGSINGSYTLKGQYTCIRGNVALSPDVKFDGTFNNIPTVYVDWFIRDYKANVDCSEGIRKAITFAKLARTSLSFGGLVSTNAAKYFCTSGNFDISGLVVNGNGSWIVGIGDYNMFTVNGDCHLSDLHINKYPYQDGSSNVDYNNIAITCKNNHHMEFDNISIDGFHFGFILEKAWNVVIIGCNTYRCSVGVGSRGLSVNNNICNCRLEGSVCGIEVLGISEGWMISDNLIIGATGINLTNHANTIIKGNIIDFCKNYAIRMNQNCPGVLIDNNYMAVEGGGLAIIDINSQDIKNNEDQMISITNNIMRGYGLIQGIAGVGISKGKYKHIKICGNHIKSGDLPYGVSIGKDVRIGTLYFRDNVVEGKDNNQTFSIKGIVSNMFVSDNIKTGLKP